LYAFSASCFFLLLPPPPPNLSHPLLPPLRKEVLVVTILMNEYNCTGEAEHEEEHV
jgi:hypothetical protein